MGDEFTLRVRFRFGNRTTLHGGGFPHSLVLCGRSAVIEEHTNRYVIVVEGFPDEVAAKDFVGCVHTALRFMGISKYLPVEFTAEFSNLESVSKKRGMKSAFPSLDGFDLFSPNGLAPSVHPSSMRMTELEFTAEHGGSSIGIIPEVIELIEKGSNSKELFGSFPDRVQDAVDLYKQHYYEMSDRSRLLILMVAIERLFEAGNKHDVATKLLEKWAIEVKGELKKYKEGTAEYSDLSSLEGELKRAKETSKGSKLRGLVRDRLSDDSVKEMEKKAVKSYGTRSKLVHGDDVSDQEIYEALRDSEEILSRVLLRAFQSESGVQ